MEGNIERLGGEIEEQRSSMKQVGGATMIGSALEWYDFFLYGTAAALVFDQIFFPQVDPLIGTLAALATYSVGFFARPVGGIVFGHYGDKIGRKAVLVTTLILMGISTACIGLLPSYGSIGIAAPILLLVLRILQGFGAGAEYSGAVIMAVEHAPPKRRGLHGSWPPLGVQVGLLMATGIFGLFSALPEEQFLSWGWRIPFLLSLLLVAVGIYVRLRILETPSFAKVMETQTQLQSPVKEAIRTHPRQIAVVFGARIAENGVSYVWSVFSLTYATEQLGIPRSTALTGVVLGALISIATIPAFGLLSDRIGRRPVYMFGAAFSGALAFPFFWLFDTETPVLIWLALILGIAVGIAAMFGPQAAYFTELFGTRVRYSGFAFGRELSSVLAGGLSPLIAVALLAAAGGDPWPVAVYVIFMSVISFVAVFLGPETKDVDLGALRPEERDLVARAAT